MAYMDRSNLLDELPDGEDVSAFEEHLIEFLNEVEGRVIDAKEKLAGIESVQDLGNVEDALDILSELADDLY